MIAHSTFSMTEYETQLRQGVENPTPTAFQIYFRKNSKMGVDRTLCYSDETRRKHMRTKQRTYKPYKQIRLYSDWQFEHAVRELIQNAMDHLKLLDPSGFLRKDVKLYCDGQHWLKFDHANLGPLLWIHSDVENEQLRICQWYTNPLCSATLNHGVPNLKKDFKQSAGGFGIGFKDAAIAALARNGKMEMRFDALGQDEDDNYRANGARWFCRTYWKFCEYENNKEPTNPNLGRERVLIVRQKANKWRLDEFDVLGPNPVYPKLLKPDANDPFKTFRANTMLQTITWPNMGDTFWTNVVPMFVMMWDSSSLLPLCNPAPVQTDIPTQENKAFCLTNMAKKSDILCTIPKLHSKILQHHPQITIKEGIYIQGIFVTSLKENTGIPNAVLLSGPHGSLKVTNSDRNHVQTSALVKTLARLLKNLTPENRKFVKKELKWLIDTDKFTNTLLVEQDPSNIGKQFWRRVFVESRTILYEDLIQTIFGYPRNATFYNAFTDSSVDTPFAWAFNVCKNRGFPIYSGNYEKTIFQISNNRQRCEDLLEKATQFILDDTRGEVNIIQQLVSSFSNMFQIEMTFTVRVCSHASQIFVMEHESGKIVIIPVTMVESDNTSLTDENTMETQQLTSDNSDSIDSVSVEDITDDNDDVVLDDSDDDDELNGINNHEDEDQLICPCPIVSKELIRNLMTFVFLKHVNDNRSPSYCKIWQFMEGYLCKLKNDILTPEDILKIEQYSNGQYINVSMESEQDKNQQHAELTSSLILKTLKERFLPEMTDIISDSYRTRKRQRI